MPDGISTPLESKLLQVLEAIEVSLVNQGHGRQNDFQRDPGAELTKSIDGVSRLAGTFTFHLERAVGGLVGFRNALNFTYDRLNDPQRRTVSRLMINSDRTDTKVGAPDSRNSSSSNTDPSAVHRFRQLVDRESEMMWDAHSREARLRNRYNPVPSPASAPGNNQANSAVNRFTSAYSSTTTSQSREFHTAGQKNAAASALAASKLQMVVDGLGTAATMFTQVAATFAKVFEAGLQAGAPDAFATVTKSFKLLLALLGNELVPVAAEFARYLQELARDWQSLDASTRKSATGLLLAVSGLEMLAEAAKAFVDALKWMDKNGKSYGLSMTGARIDGREGGGKDAKYTGFFNSMPPVQMDRWMQKQENWWVRNGSAVFRAFNPLNMIGKALGWDAPDKPGDKADQKALDKAFGNLANPQFMALDQVWRQLQLNLLGGDSLDAQMLKLQVDSNQKLASIDQNTGDMAKRPAGARVVP